MCIRDSILGKPLEEAPYGGLEDIRAAAQASGEWPLRDYVSDAMLPDVYKRQLSNYLYSKERLN